MTAALYATSIRKSFSNRRVLDIEEFCVAPGEVVGLVGQNGSGKSTLIKILSGVYSPDHGGRLDVLGRQVELPVPAGSSTGLGLAFVHQDLGLFLDGSVLENLRLGRYRTGLAWRIDWDHERAACREALDRVGLDVSPDAMVRDLSQVDRALVAVARAVDQTRDAAAGGVIVLDEPTSYLPRDGVDRLFAAVRELRAAGFGVIFVSHRIDEVLELSDTVVVLREGSVAARFAAADVDQDHVVEAMLGRSIENFYPETLEQVAQEPVLVARGVTGQHIEQVDLTVRRGEIVGVTGLLGMGQERVLYLLTGAIPATGELELAGGRYQLRTMTPRRARAIGLALLPADRVQSSGVQEATVLENITLATLSSYVRLGVIRHARERAAVAALISRYDVNPEDPDRQFRTLSGGNQQKALLAKWLESRPSVVLLHEPTQGVDVGAKQQIFRLLRDATRNGVSIVIATTEYEDLAALCDRVVVMREGRSAVELEGAALTHERLVEECYRSVRHVA